MAAPAMAHTKPPTQPSTVLCGLRAGAGLVFQTAADEERARIAQPRDDERQQQIRRLRVVQAEAHKLDESIHG